MLHVPPTNLLLLAAKQEPYKKAYLLTKNIEEFSGKSSGEWTSRQKKGKTERVIGLGRRTREEIVKRNQTTALRFQTGGRRQTSPTSLRGEEEEKEEEEDVSSWILTFSSSTQGHLRRKREKGEEEEKQ